MTDIDKMVRRRYRRMQKDFVQAWDDHQARFHIIEKYEVIAEYLRKIVDDWPVTDELDDFARVAWLAQDVDEMLQHLYGMLRAWE